MSRKKEEETQPETQGGMVACGTCGYVLSPGEEVKFRLYETLKRFDR